MEYALVTISIKKSIGCRNTLLNRIRMSVRQALFRKDIYEISIAVVAIIV